jgi:hypothetical protein
MKKVAGFLLLMAICCSPALAQEKDSWKVFKEKPTKTRFELGGGLLYRSFSNITSTGNSTGLKLDMLGWDVYGDYRFLKWLSIGGDLSGAYHLSSENGNTQIYTVMLGPQLYPLGHNHKITPWGHILFGRGLYGLNIESQGGFNPVSHWENDYAWMAGGGLDVQFKKRWKIRLIEADYEDTNFGVPGATSYSNYRVTIGALYRFGVK